MFQLVHWADEEAQKNDGSMEKVTVVRWDYETKTGKALVLGGHLVDVSLTNDALGDLTIGVKRSPDATHARHEPSERKGEMETYTIADAQTLNTIKHRVRAVTKVLDKTGRVYPGSLEAAQVKHEVSVLLSELHVHGLLPVDVQLVHDPHAGA